MPNANSVTEYRKLGGSFGTFGDHLASGEIEFDDPLLDSCFSLPSPEPPLLSQKLLALEVDNISSTLGLPDSQGAHLLAHGTDYMKLSSPSENLPTSCYDINETLEDIMSFIHDDRPFLKTSRFREMIDKDLEGIPDERQRTDHLSYLNDITETPGCYDSIQLEVVTAAETTNAKLNSSRFALDPTREVLVNKDMIKIDELRLRDLRGMDPDLRMVKATAKEIEQLVALGVFALVRVEDVPGSKPMDSKLLYKVKYDSRGNWIKDKA